MHISKITDKIKGENFIQSRVTLMEHNYISHYPQKSLSKKNQKFLYYSNVFCSTQADNQYQKSKITLAGNYMFKVNNRNTKIRCEICSKLTKKTPEGRPCRRSGVFTVNFEL